MAKEKDFDMYIGDDNAGWSPATPPITEEGAPAWDATPATPADENVDELAKLAWEAPAAADTPPAWEATPPVETPPEWGDVTPGTEEWADSTPTDDVNWDNLQAMLDALNTWSDDASKDTQDIKAAAEEIKGTVSETDTATQAKLDDLVAKIAEKEANEIKMQKTIDVLKSEYEKTLNDKISLEYGTASDSKIAMIVNEDPDVKNLIAAKLATGDDAKEKLAQAWRTWRESISGQKLDDIISAKKQSETEALASWEDWSAAMGAGEGGLYL